MTDAKIMVVEDDRVILESMEDYLDNYDVQTFYNSREAVSMLKERSYDVIVGDYKMPYLTGLDLFREGRRYNAYNYGILRKASLLPEKQAQVKR